MAIEVHFEKRISNAAVHDVDTQRRRQCVLLTFLAALFVVGLLFYGWQQYRWIQFGYDIEAAQNQKETLKDFNLQLTLERETLARLERVESIARRELGMVAAAPGQLVTFSSEAPLAIPPAPDPAQPALTAKK